MTDFAFTVFLLSKHIPNVHVCCLIFVGCVLTQPRWTQSSMTLSVAVLAHSIKGLTELTRLELTELTRLELTDYWVYTWDIRHSPPLPEQPTLYGDLIDLSVLTKLRVLHLMRTNLESLQLDNCTKIKRIRCYCRLPACCRSSFSDLANTGPMLHCCICLFSYYLLFIRMREAFFFKDDDYVQTMCIVAFLVFWLVS